MNKGKSMKKVIKLTLSLVLMCQFTSAWSAAFYAPVYEPTNVVTVDNTQRNPWLIRLRALAVMPDDSSTPLTVIGGHISDISNAIVPEIDVSYFFTPHIATEFMLFTSRHSVKATNTALGDLSLGKISLLPPTLMLQYHFLDADQKARPYIGAGFNYALLYRADSGATASSISYDNSFGAALQAGLNVAITDHFSLNFDVKRLYIDSDVTVRALGSTMKTHVDIDPMIYSVGVGYRF
jgi:outer membrane protein